MKIREIMESTTSGSIATVSQPLGTVISRNQQAAQSNKYTVNLTPNTPDWMKKLKGNYRAK